MEFFAQLTAWTGQLSGLLWNNTFTLLLLLGAVSMTMFSGIVWLALETDVKVTDTDAALLGLRGRGPPGAQRALQPEADPVGDP